MSLCRRPVLTVFLPLCGAFLFSCSKSEPPKTAEKAPEKPVSYYSVDPATAGSLEGRILFSGKHPPRRIIDMSEDPECQKLHHGPVYDDAVEVNRNGTLKDVFIYVKEGLDGKHFRTPAEPVTIDQKGCWFIPTVFGIQTGQTLDIINSDPVTHNIHPRPHDNREWNHSQDAGAPPMHWKFTRPEVMIRVKCNIHSWMHSWIGVVDNPYFAVTGNDGSFTLKNMPPGKYTIGAWQQVLGAQEQQVEVPPSGNAAVTFSYKGD